MRDPAISLFGSFRGMGPVSGTGGGPETAGEMSDQNLRHIGLREFEPAPIERLGQESARCRMRVPLEMRGWEAHVPQDYSEIPMHG
jgi:hypothetical protein